MKFKLFGTEIYISFLFGAVIAVMLATDRTGMALPSLFAVFMHEMGHLFCMWVQDSSPKSIKLIPASVQLNTGIGSSYKKDIIVALCGPAVNFVLFFTLFINYLAFKNEPTLYYALRNLIIGGFNMLPVKGLDGGTVLFSILAIKLDLNRAMLIMRLVTLFIAAIALVTAITLTLRGKVNVSLYIIAIYLIVMSIIKM